MVVDVEGMEEGVDVEEMEGVDVDELEMVEAAFEIEEYITVIIFSIKWQQ